MPLAQKTRETQETHELSPNTQNPANGMGHTAGHRIPLLARAEQTGDGQTQGSIYSEISQCPGVRGKACQPGSHTNLCWEIENSQQEMEAEAKGLHEEGCQKVVSSHVMKQRK